MWTAVLGGAEVVIAATPVREKEAVRLLHTSSARSPLHTPLFNLINRRILV
jgi:hypothetical protein